MALSFLIPELAAGVAGLEQLEVAEQVLMVLQVAVVLLRVAISQLEWVVSPDDWARLSVESLFEPADA